MKRLITYILVLSSLLFFTSCERNNLYDHIKENAVEDQGTDENEVTPATPDKPEIFVSTTGSDSSGDGTQVSPYRTLQYALDKAPVPSLICVGTGSYDVTSPIVMKSGVSLLGGFNPGTWERGGYQSESERAANSTIITYTGSDSGTSFLDPSMTVVFNTSTIGSNTILEGFIINGPVSVAYPCAILVNTNASPVIRYNTVAGGSASGTRGYSIIVTSGANPVISYNRIDVATVTGASSYTYGAYIYQAKATIIGNYFYAISSITENSCHVQAYSTSDVTINANNFDMGNATSTNTAVRIDTPDTAAVITGNTILGGSADIMGIYSSCSGTVIKNNVIDIAGSGISSDGIRLNGATSALVEGNTITDTGSGTTGVSGILIYGPASSSIIRRNVVILTASNTYTSCITDASESSGNKIYSNFLNANGAFGTYGVGVNVSNSSTVIVNNTILTNNTGSGESACLYLDASVVSTPVIINNIMSAKGTGSGNYGVHEKSNQNDPSNLQNNLFMDCSTAVYYDYDTTDFILLESNLNALTGGTISSGNKVQSINLTGTGVVDPGDWSYIDSAGLNISGSYAGAMIDLAGTARVVPLTIGAYEY